MTSWTKEGGQFHHSISLDGIVVKVSRSGSSNNNVASLLMNSGRVTFGTLHPAPPSPLFRDDLANADDNIRDAAHGKMVYTSDYGHARGKLTELSPKMLSMLYNLSNDYTYTISELAGAKHSASSRHYIGKAVDITVINGVQVSHKNVHVKAFMEKAKKLGATEVLGPGRPGHGGHIHLGMPRK